MKLCVMKADGISHEVVPAALQVLQTVLPDLEIHEARVGWDYFREVGVPIDEETIDLARHCGAVLYGAANSPSYPVEGYYSPIVRLRRDLQTHANLRPISYLPVPTARIGVNMMIVRENTEDVYSSPDQRFGMDDNEGGVVEKVITRRASEQIARTAYQLATATGRKRVTVVHKANVLPHTDGLFRRVALEVAEAYPHIETDELLVDTAAYWMVKEPTRYDMMLTTNQYGDILSDMAAAWGGGLGFIPSLNYGEHIGIAEPVHGAAPDIAGKGIGNPCAMILSAALLLRYTWHRADLAERIEQAVVQTLEDGALTADASPHHYVSTAAFTDLVCQKLATAADIG